MIQLTSRKLIASDSFAFDFGSNLHNDPDAKRANMMSTLPKESIFFGSSFKTEFGVE